MIIALTGTPGSGKTAVSSCLREKGENVVDLNQYIKDNSLKGRFDKKRDTYNVDTEELNASLKKTIPTNGNTFLDGHLSHFLDRDIIIVIRCNPSVLYERLKERNYSPEKIKENVQAEALDVILCESLGSDAHVFEIDNTSCTAQQTASAIIDIVAGRTEGYVPGNVNWEEEMIKWC
jgi:adenylate kinase